MAKRIALGAVVAATSILVAASAMALPDGQQLLIGGNSGSGPSVRYTAPSSGTLYNDDFPSAGKGEAAASVRMPAGTLSKLKVSIVTQGNASSGGVALTVRVNGVDTALACSVGTAGGNCGSGASVAVASGDDLSVEIASTLNQGFWTFSYSLVFD
jgi:hypothetical protein